MEDKKTGISEAILEFQKSNRKQKTNAENPYFKSEYVTLDRVWDDIRDDLQKLGLAVVQNPVFENGLYGVESIITHIKTGQEIRAKLVMPIAKNDPQGVGSAITYARRYCLTSQLGLTVDTDDDGNAAAKPPAPPAKPPAPPAKPADKPADKPANTDYIKQQIMFINVMLSERFGDNLEEIKAYVKNLTTWVDKDKKTHNGIENISQVNTEKQAKFLFEKIKKEYEDWMNSVNAGQKQDKEKVDNETIPF